MPGTRAERPAKAVLQEAANAVAKLIVPSTSRSALWNCLPSIVIRAGQATESVGCSPRSSRASAVTILKVEPGGYSPWKAML